MCKGMTIFVACATNNLLHFQNDRKLLSFLLGKMHSKEISSFVNSLSWFWLQIHWNVLPVGAGSDSDGDSDTVSLARSLVLHNSNAMD